MMRRWLVMLLMLSMLSNISLSASYDPLKYFKSLIDFFGGIFTNVPEIKSNFWIYFAFGAMLLIVMILIAYIVNYSMGLFLEALNITGTEKKIISHLTALLIAIMILIQPQTILAVLLISLSPLKIFFAFLFILAPFMALAFRDWTKRVLPLAASLLALIIYLNPSIEKGLAEKIAKHTFDVEGNFVAPVQVVEVMFGYLSALMITGLLVIFVIVGLIEAIKGPSSGGSS